MIFNALDGWKSKTMSSAVAGPQAKTSPGLQCGWSSESHRATQKGDQFFAGSE